MQRDAYNPGSDAETPVEYSALFLFGNLHCGHCTKKPAEFPPVFYSLKGEFNLRVSGFCCPEL